MNARGIVGTLAQAAMAIPVAVGLMIAAASAVRADIVTVLLVLEPQKADGSDWDFDEGADPILCALEGCYISRGLKYRADFRSGKVATRGLSQFRLGSKAGACTDKLRCAFRAIPLTQPPGMVRPIDIDIFDHDELQAYPLAADKSCAVKDGVLGCTNGVFTPNYSLWVVPRAVAEKAGAAGLDYALFRGISRSRVAYFDRYLKEERKALADVVGDFYQLVANINLKPQCRRNADLILDTFSIAKILHRSDRAFHALLEDFLDPAKHKQLMQQILRDPSLFWRIRTAIDQFHQYASAEGLVEVDDKDTIELKTGTGQALLHVGWAIHTRAKALGLQCRAKHNGPV